MLAVALPLTRTMASISHCGNEAAIKKGRPEGQPSIPDVG
jgi:hypothetical protein